MSIINNIKKTLRRNRNPLLYASGATILIIGGIGYLVRHGILRPFYKNSETQTIDTNNGEIIHPEDIVQDDIVQDDIVQEESEKNDTGIEGSIDEDIKKE